ncbi:hypothetical protein BB559_006191 [Furculomyces boomerangus]|uniref:Calcipressin n=2 Tax=Harpellales TaxID=61421 RepID=A0A2T9Y4C2_9FUNG|nr:hypothetical protein BB559_006191 [Furculomyces boomerangus]PWA02421.1 hypothetical protein BB558_001435 [Smittium angustum]
MTNKKNIGSIIECSNSLVILFTKYNNTAADLLYEKLKEFGDIYHFSKLKSFSRCLVVYRTTIEAKKAKESLENYEIEPGNKLRMYFSLHTPLSYTTNSFLEVPKSEKLMLISPPGSPIIGWTQNPEDSPNKTYMDDNLVKALEELKSGVYKLDMDDVESVVSFNLDNGESSSSRIEQDFGPQSSEQLDFSDEENEFEFSSPESNASDEETQNQTPEDIELNDSDKKKEKTKFLKPTFIIEDFDTAQSQHDGPRNKISRAIHSRPVTPIPRTCMPPN